MAEALSPYRQRKARELYNIFNVFHSLSWQFLAGNIITLFAMRLGGNSAYIGILNAVAYVAFFFLPLGKILTNRFSIIKIYSAAWIGRALGMLPILAIPFVFTAEDKNTALLLLLLSMALFHIIRGIGMIGNSPVLSFLSAGPDRGSYTTQIQIINSAVGMFAGFLIALVLGRDPPIFLYALIVGVGIIASILSGLIMRRIPGPEKEKSVKNKNIIEITRGAMAHPPLRLFIFILLMVAFVSGVSRIFIVVYSREVFLQSDGMVSLYAVFGGLGTLLAMLVIKFLVDQIGAKPIFLICVIIGLVSMIPILVFPASMGDNFTTVTLYLCFLFFILNFGWLGADGIMQTYFLGLVPQDQIMDMGILFFLGYGIAGAGGSLLSGFLLDITATITGSVEISFKAFYALLILLTSITLLFMRKLTPLGALPLKDALEVMFSFRDLKAISLVEKLRKTSAFEQEEAILGALHDTPSNMAIKGLLIRARSPKLSVRMESIRAIDALPELTNETEKVLMDDIINNPFTSAYRSARALGNHRVFPAVALLRELALSSDYMLAGEAMIALAKLKDNAFRPKIEQIITETNNPRLIMAGIEALGIYGYPDSLPLLLDTLHGVNPPPYLRDEVVLAMSSILDIQNEFYPLLIRFLADESQGHTLAMDEAESAFEYYSSAGGRRRNRNKSSLAALSHQAKTFHDAVSDYIRNSSGNRLCRWILELPDELVEINIKTVLSESVVDNELTQYSRLQLVIVHWASLQLRLWTDQLKEER